MDRIFACFKRYNFWSMKALRAELQQPEAYIREVLEKIAEMPRSGRFAMHWTLKATYRQGDNLGADESAPTRASGSGAADDSDTGDVDGEDDDDDDVKMEDVLPS
jgi:transcription initiation factor TFIIF subunit beta